MRLLTRFMSALLGDTAFAVLCMAWGVAWQVALVCSWNDWAFVALVLLTIAPFGYTWDWHERQAAKWGGRYWDLVHAQNLRLAERR
jgi:hypothetical protein